VFQIPHLTTSRVPLPLQNILSKKPYTHRPTKDHLAYVPIPSAEVAVFGAANGNPKFFLAKI